jgi:N-acetylneuraminic acid mutarotase
MTGTICYLGSVPAPLQSWTDSWHPFFDWEALLWGGSYTDNVFNTGGRYNPLTDTWTSTNLTNAPTARTGATAVWTGSEMIVWGGGNAGFTQLNTGGRYNPTTDSWTSTSLTNAPSPRMSHGTVDE